MKFKIIKVAVIKRTYNIHKKLKEKHRLNDLAKNNT